MKALKLFLFDLDGTLVTTGGAGLRALERVFKDLYRIEHALAHINPAGKTDPAIFREVIRTHFNRDVQSDEWDKLIPAYLTGLAQEIGAAKGLRPHAGVVNFLEALKKRLDVLMGLGTGNLEAGARIKLEPTGLNSYFEFGGYGSDAENRAELLSIAHRRAEKRGQATISPSHVYVVGDTELDIQAARRAGFRTVAVATGGRSYSTLKEYSPDYLFADLTQADGFLESLETPQPLPLS